MSIIKLTCNECSVEETFKIGPDEEDLSLGSSLDKAKEHFKGKTKLQISSLQKKHQIDKSTYGYEILTCPNCQTLINQYTIEVEYDKIMLFKPFFKCQLCSSTLEKMTTAITDILASKYCSSCGKKALELKK